MKNIEIYIDILFSNAPLVIAASIILGIWWTAVAKYLWPAFSNTKINSEDDIIRASKGSPPDKEELDLFTARVYRSTYYYNKIDSAKVNGHTDSKSNHGHEVYADVARQVAEKYFNYLHLDPVQKLANMLPVVGLMGTVLGMYFLFIALSSSQHDNNNFELLFKGISIKILSTLAGMFGYFVLQFLSCVMEQRSMRAINSAIRLVSKDILKN